MLLCIQLNWSVCVNSKGRFSFIYQLWTKIDIYQQHFVAMPSIHSHTSRHARTKENSDLMPLVARFCNVSFFKCPTILHIDIIFRRHLLPLYRYSLGVCERERAILSVCTTFNMDVFVSTLTELKISIGIFDVLLSILCCFINIDLQYIYMLKKGFFTLLCTI